MSLGLCSPHEYYNAGPPSDVFWFTDPISICKYHKSTRYLRYVHQQKAI